MKHQSWLGRLLRRAPKQQNLSHPIAFSSTPSLPPSPDEALNPTVAASVGLSASLDPHASPAPSSSADVQAAGSGIWHIGDVILDQYEVRGILGEGGMGTVYLVHHRGWNMDLAVKSPRPELFANKGGRENFIREAQTWVNLPLHPHIVSCYYVRTLGEVPRIFAEYVAGGSLADWIKDRRLYQGGHQLALERMLDIAIQFAWGLHASHEQGLVHQDIKPANVMLTADGTAKVTDFGLARARALEGEWSNEPGSGQQSILVSSRGMTLAYCSPEQAAGQPLSRKTDIWSWAVSLLELFVGEVIWQSGILAREVLACHEPQDAVIPPMPAELVRLLASCLELRPEDRPATMLEVSQTVQEIYAQQIRHPYPRALPEAAETLASNLNNRALSLYDLGKVQEAVQVWEQALQADPLHLETTYNRGVVLWRQGELTDEQLVHQLEHVRASQARPGQAEFLLAQVHLERGDMDTALPLLQDVVQLAPEEAESQTLLEQTQERHTAAIHSLRTTQRYPERVYTVSYSAKERGRWFLDESAVRAEPMEPPEYTFETPPYRTYSVRLNDEGRWFVCASDDQVKSKGEQRNGPRSYAFWGQMRDDISTVSLSADACLAVVGNYEGLLELWEVKTQRLLESVRTNHGFVGAVYLSPDGRWLVSGGYPKGGIRLVDRNAQRSFTIPQSQGNYVGAISISVDGRWLVSGSADQTICVREILWEAQKTNHVRTFRAQEPTESTIASVSISHDGRWLLSVSRGGTIRIWDVSNGRCLRTFSRQAHLVTALGLTKDGPNLIDDSLWQFWLISGSEGQTMQRWEILDRHRSRCSLRLARLWSHADITTIATRAERLLTQARQAYEKKHFAVALDLLRETRHLPGWRREKESLEQWVRLSHLCSRVGFRAGWLIRTFQEHSSVVTKVALSADGSLAVSRDDAGTLRVWEASTGRCLHTLEGYRVYSFCLSTSGGWLLSAGYDDTIRLWETSTGRCLRSFSWAVKNPGPICLSPDGRWFASSDHSTIQLWEISTGRRLWSFQGSHLIDALQFSADGCWIISVHGVGEIERWEVSTRRSLHVPCVLEVSPRSKGLSLDGRWAFFSSMYDLAIVQLVEIASGQKVNLFRGDTLSTIGAVCLSADERWAVTGNLDNTIQLWEMATGRCWRLFGEHADGVSSVCLSADGHWLLSGGFDQTMRLWELDWELEAHEPAADWDEGARSSLETFLTQHTPYAGELPQDREPTVQEIQQALTRQGTPTWTEEDFQGLLRHLQDVGYGWLRPEGVLSQLEQMASSWQGPPSSLF